MTTNLIVSFLSHATALLVNVRGTKREVVSLENVGDICDDLGQMGKGPQAKMKALLSSDFEGAKKGGFGVSILPV